MFNFHSLTSPSHTNREEKLFHYFPKPDDFDSSSKKEPMSFNDEAIEKKIKSLVATLLSSDDDLDPYESEHLAFSTLTPDRSALKRSSSPCIEEMNCSSDLNQLACPYSQRPEQPIALLIKQNPSAIEKKSFALNLGSQKENVSSSPSAQTTQTRTCFIHSIFSKREQAEMNRFKRSTKKRLYPHSFSVPPTRRSPLSMQVDIVKQEESDF